MARVLQDRSKEACQAVLRTDYSRWCEQLRELSARPLVEQKIPLDELRTFLSHGTASKASWVVPDLGQPLFPKIAVVSWKCFPWLLPADPGLDLGRFCSDRMRRVLGHWVEAKIQPVLRFFPLVDYRDVTEIRFRLQRGTVTVERSIGHARDGSAANTLRRAHDVLTNVRPHVDDVRVDIAVPEQQERKPWLIEINPLRSDRMPAGQSNRVYSPA